MAASSIPFENTYSRLPAHFHARVNPTPVASPRLLALNTALARDLNLDPTFLSSPEGVSVLAGNTIAPGSEPLAIAYAGHQFGSFVPSLGDGRANLLGEVRAHDGHLYDLQLKGSGPTPFSRRGDGRAALGPVLREYLVSESMHALGIPTTRSLAAVSTGQPVLRETPQPGAVLTRVARSHLRVGTFQYFTAQEDTAALRTLTAYAIHRHYPGAQAESQPTQAFLTEVIGRHARLVARWMLIGFIHGVMNTDNTSISGETLDFGPCAFMESFDPAQVYSSIDFRGRYSYSNQPHAAHWNLARLAEALLPLLTEDLGAQEAALEAATTALGTFGPTFEQALNAGWRSKLGLLSEQPGDTALTDELLSLMAAHQADFTLTFSRLSAAALQPPDAPDPTAEHTLRSTFTDPTVLDAWLPRWRTRLAAEPTSPADRAATLQHANPVTIPRNHLVEAALQAAGQGDLQPFQSVLDAVTHPFAPRPAGDLYTIPATPAQCIRQTFCGT